MISTELQRIIQAKADIVTSIENKGVTVPAGTKIDDLDDYVDQIQAGGSDEWTEEEMFTITALTDGTVTIQNTYNNATSGLNSFLMWKKNNGQWNTHRFIYGNVTTIDVLTGDTIKVYGINMVGHSTQNGIFNGTAEAKISGYINSLCTIKKTYEYDTTSNILYSIFRGWTTLIDAEDLIIKYTSLSSNVSSEHLAYMFYNCTNLTKAPKQFEAPVYNTTVRSNFYGCSKLTTIPEYNFHFLYLNNTGCNFFLQEFGGNTELAAPHLMRSFKGDWIVDLYNYLINTNTYNNTRTVYSFFRPYFYGYRADDDSYRKPFLGNGNADLYKYNNIICYIDYAKYNAGVCNLIPEMCELVWVDSVNNKYYLFDGETECDEYGVALDPNYEPNDFYVECTDELTGNTSVSFAFRTSSSADISIYDYWVSDDSVNWYRMKSGSAYIMFNSSCNKVYVRTPIKSNTFQKDLYINTNTAYNFKLGGDLETLYNCNSCSKQTFPNVSQYFLSTDNYRRNNAYHNWDLSDLVINNAESSYCLAYAFCGNSANATYRIHITALPQIKAKIIGGYAFQNMFYYTDFVNGIKYNSLNFDSVSNYSCQGMFSFSNITESPVLNIGTLGNSSYAFQGMFNYCSSLITINSINILDNKLTNYCFINMFGSCTSLTTIPQGLLPYTNFKSGTLTGEGVYSGMFSGCTALTTVPSDLLPATNLTTNCYKEMFKGCTSMTTGPDLLAYTLVNNCYYYMFNGCTSLSSIKYGGSVVPSSTYCNSWVSSVPAVGNFYKNQYVDWTNSFGTSAIPTGWTVSTYEGQKDPTNYFYLKSLENGSTVSVVINGSPQAGYWKWTKNLVDWYDFDSTITLNNEEKLYLRGENLIWSNSSTNYRQFSMTGKFEAGGDIRSLYNKTEITNNTTALPYAFGESLFENCTSLYSVKNLTTGYTNYNNKSYAFMKMFYGCTNLQDFMTWTMNTGNSSNYIGSSMYINCTNISKYYDAVKYGTPGWWMFTNDGVNKIHTNQSISSTNWQLYSSAAYTEFCGTGTVSYGDCLDLDPTMTVYVNSTSYTIDFDFDNWENNNRKIWSGNVGIPNGANIFFSATYPVYVNNTLQSDFVNEGYTATQNYTNISVEMTQVNSEWVYQVTLS